MAFSITGQIKVTTLKKRFLKEFGLTLRVYDGRSFADESPHCSWKYSSGVWPNATNI